ncbi:PHP domain protein [Methanococcus vannielii SB]|uniref:PHP domain protein n=1 Tax=Methanococcus vannielii (strain ATCC 35089 / DSM 1224 / JCM 13029 / OCM 148 / SB) TaxID=406327 RepID=A6URZ0_METVS|nr:PHP-associated domain-containing protein [Methanococcus vannielii]ABR55262.1 PHP domain protein [Methanococcus vannielii SB]
MIKIDMHVHTHSSRCSMNFLNILKKTCLKKGILPIITDHDVMTKTDFGIPGEEISTSKGEFCGIFLNEEIKEKDIFEAFDKVKEQGGLIYIPHPFDWQRKRSLCKFGLLDSSEFIKKVDIVEIYNSRCIEQKPNEDAKTYAKSYNIVKGVGSDAHFFWEVGNAFLEIPEFDLDNPKEFLKLLSKAQSENFYCKRSNPNNMLVCSKLSKRIKKLM